MNVLIGPDWFDRVAARAEDLGVEAQWIVYDDEHLGPFPGAEALLRSWQVRRWQEALDNAPDLRWVHTPSAGVNSVIEVTGPRGLALTESGRAFRTCIGEFIVAQMFFIAKRLGPLWDKQQRGRREGEKMTDLAGKTVGVVGLGPIGLGAAERATALGMHVIGCRRSGEPIENITDVVAPDRLHELLGRSDYVVIACPLTERTRGMFDAEAFAAIKPGAWLINIARGRIVQTDALLAALDAGRLAGACLDVTDPEPLPAGHPLWRRPNVFITPHTSSGDTEGMRQAIIDCFLENLQRFQAGQPLLDRVDYDRGY